LFIEVRYGEEDAEHADHVAADDDFHEQQHVAEIGASVAAKRLPMVRVDAAAPPLWFPHGLKIDP